MCLLAQLGQRGWEPSKEPTERELLSGGFDSLVGTGDRNWGSWPPSHSGYKGPGLQTERKQRGGRMSLVFGPLFPLRHLLPGLRGRELSRKQQRRGWGAKQDKGLAQDTGEIKNGVQRHQGEGHLVLPQAFRSDSWKDYFFRRKVVMKGLAGRTGILCFRCGLWSFEWYQRYKTNTPSQLHMEWEKERLKHES